MSAASKVTAPQTMPLTLIHLQTKADVNAAEESNKAEAYANTFVAPKMLNEQQSMAVQGRLLGLARVAPQQDNGGESPPQIQALHAKATKLHQLGAATVHNKENLIKEIAQRAKERAQQQGIPEVDAENEYQASIQESLDEIQAVFDKLANHLKNI